MLTLSRARLLRRFVSGLLVVVFLPGGGELVASIVCSDPAPGEHHEVHAEVQDQVHTHGADHAHGPQQAPSDDLPDAPQPDAPRPDAHGLHDGCPLAAGSVMTCGASATLVPPSPDRSSHRTPERVARSAAPALLPDGPPSNGPFRPPRG